VSGAPAKKLPSARGALQFLRDRGAFVVLSYAMAFRHVHAFGLGAVLAAVAVALVVLFTPSRKIAREPRLPLAGHLPEAARAALRTQMREHARVMLELVSTVTVLDYDAVTRVVGRVLAEPTIARPVSNDATELNRALPERFFVLQDELRERLRRIEQAAARHDPDASAEALGAAINTCVHCHDAYLAGK
jgi:hypothetical protein